MHRAPEFRQMLLDIADGQLEVTEILADWLTERGDHRGETLRQMGRLKVREYNDGGVSYWRVEHTDHHYNSNARHLSPDRAKNALIAGLLSLFAEGPSWKVTQRSSLASKAKVQQRELCSP